LGSLQTKLRIFGAEVLNFCFKPHTPSIPYLWPRAILNTFQARAIDVGLISAEHDHITQWANN